VRLHLLLVRLGMRSHCAHIRGGSEQAPRCSQKSFLPKKKKKNLRVTTKRPRLISWPHASNVAGGPASPCYARKYASTRTAHPRAVT